MGKYIVSGELIARMPFDVEIEADSMEEARESILEDPRFDDQEQGEYEVFDWDVLGVEDIESEEDAETDEYEDNGSYYH